MKEILYLRNVADPLARLYGRQEQREGNSDQVPFYMPQVFLIFSDRYSIPAIQTNRFKDQTRLGLSGI